MVSNISSHFFPITIFETLEFKKKIYNKHNMCRTIQMILDHFIFTKALSVTKVMKVGCQVVFQKVLKVFAIFCNAMYYSSLEISYIALQDFFRNLSIKPFVSFLQNNYSIAVPLVNMDFNSSIFLWEIYEGTEILKLMYVQLYVP